jgi:hypothetical protein
MNKNTVSFVFTVKCTKEEHKCAGVAEKQLADYSRTYWKRSTGSSIVDGSRMGTYETL